MNKAKIIKSKPENLYVNSDFYEHVNFNNLIKYRIPTIKEFINGFKYEVYSDGYFEEDLEDFAGWYKYTIGKDCWRDIEDIERELMNGNIRVLSQL